MSDREQILESEQSDSMIATVMITTQLSITCAAWSTNQFIITGQWFKFHHKTSISFSPKQGSIQSHFLIYQAEISSSFDALHLLSQCLICYETNFHFFIKWKKLFVPKLCYSLLRYPLLIGQITHIPITFDRETIVPTVQNSFPLFSTCGRDE